MALITEVAQLRLSLDGQQAVKTLAVLELETKKLKVEQKDLEKQLQESANTITRSDVQYQILASTLKRTEKEFGKNSVQYSIASTKLNAYSTALLHNNEKHQQLSSGLSDVNEQIDFQNTHIQELRKSEGDLLLTSKQLIAEGKLHRDVLLNETIGSDRYNESLKRTIEIENEKDRRSQISGRNGGFGRAVAPKVEKPTDDNTPSAGIFGTIGAKVAGVIGIAMGAKEVITDIIEIGTEYKKLNVLLDSSVSHNQALFKEGKALIRSFSDDFGIGLGEVTETFVRMNNLGITPTRQSLTQVSDFALANKKTINDYVEAIADAQTGENERLKEFGIKSAKHGDKIIYTYKGISTEVKNNAQAINEYLLGLGSLNSVAGITAELGKSASAQWVKFMNIIKDIAFSVFNFFEPAIASMIKGLSSFATGIADVFDKTGGLTRKYEEQRQVVSNLATSTEPLLKRYDELKSKTNLSKIEQTELNKIVSTLATTLPASALQFDKYGNAIGVSTDKAREFIKIQKAMLKAQNAELLLQLDKDLKAQEDKVINLSRRVGKGAGKWSKPDENGKVWFEQEKTQENAKTAAEKINDIFSNDVSKNITIERFSALNKQLKEAASKTSEIKSAIKGLSGENLENPVITKSQTTKPTTSKTGPTKAEDSAAKKKADEEKKLEQTRLENHQKLLDEELRLENEYISDKTEKQKKALQLEYDINLRKQEELKTKREISEEDFNNWVRINTKKLKYDTNQIQDKADAEYYQKVRESAQKTAIAQAESELNIAKKKGDNQEIYAKEIAVNILEEQLAIIIGGEETESAIRKRYALKRAELEIALNKEVEDNKTKITKSSEDAREKYEQIQGEKKAKEEALKAEQIKTAKTELAKKGAQEVNSAIFNYVKAGINAQITEEDAKHQKLIALNDQQLANKQISQAQHDKNAVALETKHQKKIIELKKKQAIYDKAKAIFDIAINTAVEAIKAGPILAPWVVASGVIAAAAVAAQPLPEYFYGGNTGNGDNAPKTNDGKGGFHAILHPNELIVSNADLQTDWGQAIQHIYESRTINNSIINNSNSTQNNGQNNNQTSDNQDISKALHRISDSTENLNETIKNGITAKTHFTNHDIDNISKIQGQNAKIKQESLNY